MLSLQKVTYSISSNVFIELSTPYLLLLLLLPYFKHSISTHPSFPFKLVPPSAWTSTPSFCLSFMRSALLLLPHFITFPLSSVLPPLRIMELFFSPPFSLFYPSSSSLPYSCSAIDHLSVHLIHIQTQTKELACQYVVCQNHTCRHIPPFKKFVLG